MTLLIGYSRAGGTYIDLVNSYSPIAFWPLNETSGTNAHCEVTSSQDGTYADVTLDSTAGPFGEINAPYFKGDGSSSEVDIYTSTLETAWSNTGGTLSVLMWYKPDSGQPSKNMNVLTLYDDAFDDYVRYARNAGFWSNSIVSGGTARTYSGNVGVSTDWRAWIATIDQSSTTAKLYENTTVRINNSISAWTFSAFTSDSIKIAGTNSVQSSFVPMKAWGCYVAIFDTVLDSTAVDALVNYS